jgi:5-methylcytosine-specific restriction protein A
MGVCLHPNCSRRTDGKHRYCSKHLRESKSYYRDPEIQRFYQSERWKKARQLKLNRDPLCELCLQEGKITPAQMCHHTLPVKTMIENALDPMYLVSLCHPHHNQVESEIEKAADDNEIQGKGD